jgi:uncharacterized repeat protein (TIGR03803 family)
MSKHVPPSVQRSARVREILARACIEPLETRRLLTATLTTLHSFDYSDGSDPSGGLVADSSGNLYGTTADYSENNGGSVFEVDPSTQGFDTLGLFASGHGAESDGSLLMDSHGNLYGTTNTGGANNDGAVFELVAGSGTVTTLASFGGLDQYGNTLGINPVAGLIMDSSGNLYGTTEFGGAGGDGTVFEYTPGASAPVTLASFDSFTNGSEPQGGLYRDSAGDLFGTTGGTDSVNGGDGEGTVFELAAGSNSPTTLYDFTGTNGAFPTSNLVADASGNLYGTTSSGGSDDDGTVFEVAASTLNVTMLASVPSTLGDGPSSPVVDDAGDVFATTNFGGNPNNYGHVFEVVAGSGVATDVYGFAYPGSDGESPEGPLVADSAGNLYGVTAAGGTDDGGTVFELTGSGYVVPTITVTEPTAYQDADAGQPQSFDLGSFTATDTTAPYTVTVNWGDGSANTTFSQAAPGTITPQSHTYSSTGYDEITVTVTDSADTKGVGTAFAYVKPAPAVTPPSNQSAAAGTAQSFNLGSFTESGGGGPYDIDVSWGDGTADTTFTANATGTIAPQSHAYAATGNDTVTVTVTDTFFDNDTSGAATFTVDVASITVTPAANQSATAQQAQSFDLGSFTESNATGPYSVDVNWGDDGPDTTFTMNAAGTIPATSHTYGSSGDDTVSVTVTDSAGHTSNTGTFTAEVAPPVITIGYTPPPEQSAVAGVSKTFDLGSFTESNAPAPYTLTVTWGDGSEPTTFTMNAPGTITPQAHTYASPGTEPVTMNIAAANGDALNEQGFDIVVAAAPSITVTPPADQPATAGAAHSFALGSFAETNATGPYTVDVNWGDGTADTTFTANAAGTIAPQSHTYAAAGSDTVSVSVTDADGVTSNTATFTANPASITVTPASSSPQQATAGTTQVFNLGSFAETNATAPYSVDVSWGDGSADSTFTQNAPGAISSDIHTYSSSGTDNVSVTVTDANGVTSTGGGFTVDVAPAPVSITVTAPADQSATAGQSQSFSLGSFTESNATAPYSVDVAWGDGTADTTFTMNGAGTITPQSHTYADAGTPQVSVTVTDSANHTSNTATFTANVANPASLSVTPPSDQDATTGVAESFDLGTLSESNATAPYSIDVSWGDGTADTTFTVNAPGTLPGEDHTYASDGSYTVSVTATDAANHASSPATFNVTSESPSLAVTPPSNQSATAGQSQSFNLGSFTATDDSGPYSVDVSWGDGSADTTFTMNADGTITPQSHTYATAATDTVSVTVSTEGESSSPATFTVVVAAAPSITVTPPATQSAATGVSQSFGLGSFAETGATAPYTVDVAWGDGTADTTFTMNAPGTITPQSHSYAAAGDDTVSVTVTDSASHTSNVATFTADVATIDVSGAGGQSATAGTAQSFNLGGFTESNATAPYTVSVNWGDGTAVTTFTMNGPGTITPQSHDYASASTYYASVTVGDSAGHTSSASPFMVTVSNPVTTLTTTPPADQDATASSPQWFDLGTFTESNGTAPYTVTVVWGDGTSNTTFTMNGSGTIPSQYHTFSAAGTDTVSVSVADSANHASNQSEFDVDVAPAPSLTVTPPADQSAVTQESQSFNLGSLSESGAYAPYNVNVDWGDGTAETNFTVNSAGTLPPQPHTYADAGQDTVTINVSDSGEDSANPVTFNVNVVAPSVTVTPPADQNATTGVAQSFNLGSFAETGATSPYTVTVNWDDGTAETTFTMNAPGTITSQTHTFAQQTSYDVSVSVSDSAGHESSPGVFTVNATTAPSINVTPPADQTATSGVSQSFTLGSFSETNDTGPYTVDVAWGDGSSDTTFTMNAAGTIPARTHTYTDPNSPSYEYPEVTVSDTTGHEGDGGFQVTVSAPATTLVTTPPSNQDATANVAQSFALGSFTESNATGPYTVTVVWGDGTSNSTFTMNAAGTITPQTHTYTATGSDAVYVSVADSANHVSNQSEFGVTVAAQPAITVTPPGSEQYATAGRSQSFDLGSFAETNVAGPYSVDVNWGDGSADTTFTMNAAGTITPQSHTYDGTGYSYKNVVVTVTGAGGTSGTGDVGVDVYPVPTVTPPADQTAVAGTSKSFNLGSFTETNGNGPYSVDVSWGDGTADTTFTMNAAGTITPQPHDYAAGGDDTVEVTVTDTDAGTSDSATFAVDVTAISVTPPADQSATAGEAQTFSLGSFAEVNGTAPYTVRVDWGDQSAATTFTMNGAGTITPQSHAYADAGTPQVSVIVTDADGNASNAGTFTVDVGNQAAITVSAPPDQDATAGVPESFALGTLSESNATAPYTIDVSWGDGTADTTFTVNAPGTLPNENHTYANDGLDTVSVTATDSANHASSPATFGVTVESPSITVTPPANQSATAGQSQSFNLGSFTATDDSGPYSVEVSWGDGTADTTFTMNAAGTITPQSHTYAAAASDTVSVTVSTEGESSSPATFTVVVAAAPSITVTPPADQNATTGVAQSFALGSFAETGATGPYTVTVNWDDGSAQTTFTMNAPGTITPQTHTFAQQTSYDVSVSVTDSASHESGPGIFTVNATTAPSLTATPPADQSAVEGDSQTFNLGSFTESNATAPYTVDVDWGDGLADTTFTMNGAGTIAPQAHQYNAAGSDTVSVKVTDSANHTSNIATFTVTVAAVTITATPPAAPADQVGTAGVTETFNLGSFAASDVTGPYSVVVDWDSNDGQPEPTEVNYTESAPGPISETFEYAASGSYTVDVQVTASGGQVVSNQGDFTIVVGSPTLTATAPANQSATAGAAHSFALGSFTEQNATAPYTVSVDWGDGATGSFTMNAPGTIAPESHTYASAGSDTVGVYVTDADGNVSNEVYFTATVAAAPSVTVTPPPAQTATNDVSRSFALGSFAETNDTGPYTVDVAWGDGSPDTTFTMNAAGTITPQAHTYDAPSTPDNENALVTVTDTTGHQGSAGFTVTVQAPATTITVTPAGNQTATTNQSQSFALGSFTESNATGPYTVDVNWGDDGPDTTFTMNAAGTIPAASHAYASAGNDTVSVTVTDSASHTSNVATFTATVTNPVTTITLTAPSAQSATAGSAQSFALGSFTESNATGPYTVSVVWGDGAPAQTFTMNGPGTIAPETHTYAGSGPDTVDVTVTDSASHSSNTASFTVNVAAAPVPSVTLTGPANQTATEGESQSFNLGSFTEANATAPYTVSVAWGDGTYGTYTANAAGTIAPEPHTYTASGQENAEVFVTDADGTVSNDVDFTVNVVAPTVTITVTPPAGQSATQAVSQSFALGSFAESNATGPYTVSVNWGDGAAPSQDVSTFTASGPGTIAPAAHDYGTAGHYTASVTVTDADGNTSNAGQFTVTVAAPVTTITVTPPAGQTATAGTAQQFALGSFTQSNATAPYSVTVTWGDGSAATTFTQNGAGSITPQAHTYAAAGSDTVSVVITDADGHVSNTATFTNTVNPAPTTITVSAASGQSATAGQAQSFLLGSFTEANATAPYTVDVSWGDGTADTTFTMNGAGTIPAQTHDYAATGNDTVTVTVSDSADHSSNGATFSVNVVPVAAVVTVTAPADQSATAGAGQTFALGSFTESGATAPYTITVDWGDGSADATFTMNGPGAIPAQAHTYADPGNDTVSVTVADSATDGNHSNTATFGVTVATPVTTLTVTAAPAQTATAGIAQSFSLGSFAETNATGPYTVSVDWGDGSADTTFTVNAPGTITPQVHTYAAGTDTVSVTVTDSADHVSNTPTFGVTVTPQPASLTVTAAAAQSATVGEAQSFALGAFSESNATAPYTVTVNWGDGTAATTFTMNGAGTITPQVHTFGAAGSDTVSVTVSDSAGNTSNTATFGVTVVPQPVTLTVTAPANAAATAGVSQSFALGSFAETNATAPYTVTVNWGDGTAATVFTMNGAGTITPQPHTYAAAGTDTVSVTVVDSAENTSNTATFTANVSPQPVTTLAVTPPGTQSATPGVSQSFALGTFAESNGTAPYTVTVNWGDGSAATTFTMNGGGTIAPQSHTYAAAAVDTVSVTVADSAGHTSNTATFAVNVAFPTATITVSAGPAQSATAGVAQSFSLGSFVQTNGTAPYTVTVNWGDASPDTTFTMNGAGAITPQAHTYATAGSDTVSVTVTDADGNASNTPTFAVTVAPVAANVTVTAAAGQSATEGVAQTFALGGFTETNATAPYTVTVNWGDGTAATTFTMNGPGTITPQSHVYAAVGTDTVTVTVADSADHTSNAATFVATVTALAGSLTASAAAGTTATQGVAQSFALGSFAETNATAPYTVTVNWGDGSANTTFTMNGAGTITPQAHTYAVIGTDTISVTVTDAVGDSSNTATSAVNVIAAPVTSLTLTPPADQSALTGVSQEFSLGTLAEANATAPYTVTVNWGDGTAATTFTMNGPGTITPQSHTFAAIGTDTVSVTVVDAGGNASNTATFTATVARPTASITVSAATGQSATAGALQSFSLGSFAETNGVAPYTVTVDWGDGSADTTFEMNGPGTIAPESHTYAGAGSDTVSVTVADADGDVSNTATFVATVQSPVTSINLAAAGAQTATTDTAQSFSLGSFSESNATGPYTVTVNWGDGTAATVFTMNGAGTIAPQSHTYTTAGQDTVSVVVTDSAAHSSNTATFTATVTAPATSITVAAAGGQSATAGVAQAFALGSFAAANATAPYTVTVNWGDGTAATTFAIVAPGTITPQTHTYATAGSDTVSVTVTDSAGHTSNSATFVATVVPPVGVLTVTPPPDATAVQAVSQTFALGSFTETNGTAPYTVTVDWGDGSADSTFAMNGPGTITPQAHPYADVGTDTVTLTVADAAGDTSAPATFTVTVAPPEVTTLIVTPPADQSAQPGVAQSFALGSLAETNGVGPYTVSVVWGDLPDAPAQTFTMNGPGTIAPEVHTYAADGSYNATVTVTDADGDTSNTADFTILVAPPAAVITVTAPGGQTATTDVDQSFALGSFTETNATGPYTVTVNWGDDEQAPDQDIQTFTMNGPGVIAPLAHDYDAAGPFTVSVTVADAAGDTSNPATFQVNVTTPVASLTVAAAGNQSAIVGVAQAFSLGTLAESNATAPYTVTVNWGDGTAATTFTQNGPGTIAPQSHTYAAVGTDTVSVTVTDADGNASNTATFTAAVATLPASLTLTAAAAQTATVDTAQSFALGSFAESNATAPYTVTVNWGDGSAATTFTTNAPGTITPQAHTFATAGPDTVSVTVTDAADHASNTATFAVTVLPQPVTLALTGPADQSAAFGVAQPFALGSFAETNATAPYTVTVNWGDGTAATTFTMNGPGAITPQSHAFGTAGSDTVSVTVADSAGHTSNTATFTVSTSIPIGLAVTAAADQTASAGVPATFALGSFTESGATAPYTVTVNWGDGSAATTFAMNGPGTITPQGHTFAAVGTDTVSVTVTDSADHASNTATFAVTVVPQPVTLTLTAPADQSASVGTAQSFALGSFAETNATAPYTVTVNWGDGTAATTFAMNGPGTIAPQAHTFDAAGPDTVSVTVTDSAGDASNTATFAVTVVPQPVTLTVTAPAAQSATVGTAQSFALGSLAETNATAPYTVTVNWGDGTAATTFTMNGPGTITPQAHTFDAAGPDTVSVTVTDPAGDTSNTATFAVTVVPQPVTLTVTAPADQSAPFGVAQSFVLGSFAETNATAPYTVTVNWGDGTAATTFTMNGAGTITPQSHTFATAGSDTVSVTVADAAGHTSNTATFSVTTAVGVDLAVTAAAGQSASPGVPATFALGSFSESGATAPYTVTVNWGDGTAATTFTMNGPGTITPQAHTFAADGSDTVSVTVADSAGHTSNTGTFTVAVATVPTITVAAAAGVNATPGVAQSFGLGSFVETGATAPYTVTVNWGDGTAATTFAMNGPGTITPQAHTFAAEGTDTVSVTVTDSAGHTSNTATFAVGVAGITPSLVVTPPATELATAGVAQSFVLGTLAETGATGPYTVTVNWGDGTAATTFSLAAAGTITAQPHTYAAAGSDTVSVTVTDAAGDVSNLATFTAHVSAPVAVIAVTGTTNAAAMAGVSQLFALGSFTATNATAPFTVSVNWGDGTAATAFTLAAPGTITPQAHTYALAGAHTISVTVTDAVGHSSSAQTFTANVGTAAPSIAVTPPPLQAATAGTAETFPLGSFTETGGTAPYTVTVNWGDGTAATTFTMAGPGTITPQAHTYAAAGTDGVTVTVVDAAGVTSNPGTFAVDVGAPMTTTMVVTPPAAGAATAGVAGSFDLGQLAASNATTPFTVTVDWGDGSANGTYAQAGAGTITPEAHTYAAVGSDVVTVTVTDSAGHTSNAATFTVSVAQAAASTGVTTVVVHVYDDPAQSGSTSTPAAGRVVFVDANGDGIYESDETAAITDATGTATLSIPDGQTSEIAEVLPNGVVQDLPSTSEVAVVGTGVEQSVNFFTFPLKPVASNTGQFWVNYPFNNLTAPGATFETDAAVTQPDGKVLVAGVETLNGVRSAFLARYYDDGESDLNFGTDGIASAAAGLSGTTPVGIVVEPNGTIFLAANYASANGTVAYIASFTPNGSTTASPFYESPAGGGRAAVGISLMPDGSLILAGSISAGGVFATNVSQALGQPVSSFGTNGTATYGGTTALAPISAPLVNSTGGFYLVDRADDGSGASLETFSGAGVLQSAVALPANIGTGYTLQSAALQPDGDIVISGVGQSAGGLSVVIDVARITPLGAADATFGTDGLLSEDETAFVTGSGTITVDDSTVLPSGTILVTGKYDFVPTTGTAVYECFCQEYTSTGTVLLGFGQTDQIIVPTDTPFGMVALAKGSGVLPVISAGPAGDAAGPAFVDPSIGFHNTVVPPVIMLTGRSEADLDIETAAPTAVWQVPANVTAATAAPEQLQVEFTDPVSILLSSLGSDNLLVTLPDGTSELATYLGIAAGTAQDLYADYSVAAPGGTWTAADNGTYTISLVAKTVANANLSVAGVPDLGTFVVDVTNGTGSTGTDLPSTVTVAASVPSLKTGNIILFTAAVTGTGGTATGTVTFYNGTTVLGTGTVDGSGKAYYSTAALAGGTYNVTAVYSGDTTYVTSTTAAAAPLTVVPPPAGAAQLTPTVSATLVLPASVIGSVKHKFSVPIVITNTGGATAKGQVTIVLYASLDGLLDATDVVVLTVRRNVNLKAGKSIKLKLNLTDLPASLSGGAYHLLAQVEDPSGFAQTAGTVGTVAVVAPVVTPTLTFTRLSGSTSLTAGGTTRASAVLALANDGNVPLSGAATFTVYLTASGTVTATSTQVVVVSRKVSVAAGKTKSVSVPLGTIPAAATAGSYTLVAVVTTPAVNGAPAATATAADPATVTVG